MDNNVDEDIYEEILTDISNYYVSNGCNESLAHLLGFLMCTNLGILIRDEILKKVLKSLTRFSIL